MSAEHARETPAINADGLKHVTVNLPPGHPAEEDLKATGYDFADAEGSAYIYALTL